MIITNIEHHLTSLLSNAQEVWIAVALADENSFQNTQALLPDACQHYLIGVDLPTSPTVLHAMHQKLQTGRFEARIAKYAKYFHPKVFIARNEDTFSAIIGSANLTEAGLQQNHELCYGISDQEHCNLLIEWFEDLYRQAYPLTMENIREYERNYTPANDNNGATPGHRLNFTRPSDEELYFEGLNLADQFFKKDDYLAFRRGLQADRKPIANQARKKVWDRFLDLHNIIFTRFHSHDIEELDHHRREDNIVSHYYHADGYTSQNLDAMWLSYGKDRDEIVQYQNLFPSAGRDRDNERDNQSFSNHSRIQVRIELQSLGIWILFAKNDSCLFDRNHFRQRMSESMEFRQTFYEMVKVLPEPYWIRVNTIQHQVSYFQSPETLHEFTRTDSLQEYFVIGRDYNITDPELSEANFPETVLCEFQRLFPIYKEMRHYL